MNKLYKMIMITALILLAYTDSGYCQFIFDVETGPVFSGYNDVRIPGDAGTLFSLSENLDADPTAFFRAKLQYNLNNRNAIALLIAPLTIQSSGKIDKDVRFMETIFQANTPLDTDYIFNSYRLTYRYELYDTENIRFGMGLTAKIRDAEIRISGDGLESTKKNIGFVPLINFGFRWHFHHQFGLFVGGDALAAPQGRAEDILAAIMFNATDHLNLKFGYRILEGGADNDEVYTFALLHYISFGLIYKI